jgi:RimJ/RimL family protein N-acetyltransferase
MESPSIYTLPVLRTPRLVLRAFAMDDVAKIYPLANDREVAQNLASLPHPYLPEMAVEWLETLPALNEAGTRHVWAITLDFTTLVGAIGLHDIDREHSNSELGYWIGKDFWGRGYATEAASAVVKYALDDMTLERVYAKHFARNPQSGRVLEKIGMQREGVMRRHFRKWGEFQDCVLYGILRGETVK